MREGLKIFFCICAMVAISAISGAFVVDAFEASVWRSSHPTQQYDPGNDDCHHCKADNLSPSSVGVNSPSHQEIPKDNKEGSDQSKNLKWYHSITPLLSNLKITDLIQSLTAIATVVFLFQQLSINRKQIDIQNRSADSSELQTSILSFQTEVLEKQKEIARLGHLAINRPHLRVREISIDESVYQNTRLSNRTAARTNMDGQLVVFNSGGSNATIVDSRVQFFARITGGLPMGIDLSAQPNFIESGTVFASGHSALFSMRCPIDVDRVTDGMQLNGTPLYIVGQIIYIDDAQNRRVMGFCRAYSGVGTFNALDNPNYEYED